MRESETQLWCTESAKWQRASHDDRRMMTDAQENHVIKKEQ